MAAVRSPADAVVALRSLERRYRGLFAGREHDESPEDLAHRVGPDGHAALDHVVAATRTTTFLHRALEQVLLEDDPVLHPAVLDQAAREWGEADGAAEPVVGELAAAAEALAHRAERVASQDWSRRGRVASHDETVRALDLLWDAVDSAVEHLHAAERTLDAVRGRS